MKAKMNNWPKPKQKHSIDQREWPAECDSRDLNTARRLARCSELHYKSPTTRDLTHKDKTESVEYQARTHTHNTTGATRAGPSHWCHG